MVFIWFQRKRIRPTFHGFGIFSVFIDRFRRSFRHFVASWSNLYVYPGMFLNASYHSSFYTLFFALFWLGVNCAVEIVSTAFDVDIVLS